MKTETRITVVIQLCLYLITAAAGTHCAASERQSVSPNGGYSAKALTINSASSQQEYGNSTFCNPINLNYQFQESTWREAADPTVVLYNDYYCLFASHSRGYWYSYDLRDWTYVPITTERIPTIGDYAQTTVVVDNAVYYQGGRTGHTYRSTNPRDPNSWTEVTTSSSGGVGPDPDFFYDIDTDRLWCFDGLSPNPDDAIRGRELDPDLFSQIGGTFNTIYQDHANHGWERRGDDNQNSDPSWMEGPQMVKHNGTYYLQYAMPGTEFKSYGDGVYTAPSPNGPFTYATYSPASHRPSGFICGAGHGNLFQDKYGNYWKAATLSISLFHMFNRRIALFPAGFDADGQLYVNTVLGDYPITVPTGPRDHTQSQLAGWMLLSHGKQTAASSSANGHGPSLAVDEEVRTFWSAASSNEGEWFSVDLGSQVIVNAIQVNFTEYNCQSISELYHQYRIEHSSDGVAWITLVDKWNNNTDVPHDYLEFASPVNTRYLRVTSKHIPGNGTFALYDFRVFGDAMGSPPEAASVPIVDRAVDTVDAEIRWIEVPSADGYVIRYGTSPDKLYNNYQTTRNSLSIHSLNKGVDYYFALDAFNSIGYTKYGAPVVYPNVAITSLQAQTAAVNIYYDTDESAITFAAQDLKRILGTLGTIAVLKPFADLTSTPVETYIVIAKDDAVVLSKLAAADGKPVSDMGEQEYALRVTGSGATAGYWAIGGDRVGAMYGGIHLAEIAAGGSLADVKDEDQSPYITRRGLKFNIPLDYRNRTHDDRGTGPQLNIEHMWDINFWTEYLDVLARQRYNVLSLWNQHPFPHMVKLDEYPKAALDDVYKASKPGKDYDDNMVKVKDMPIDDKIKHWTKIMEMAWDRGIEIYIITWNIHLSRDRDINNLYGLSENFRDSETKDYTRKSVKQLFLTYPLLAGIGVTAGENNMWEMSDDDKEDWLWDTYGQGVIDVKKVQPNRHIRFIHRYWQTSFDKLQSRFGQLPDGYDMSYKYIKAHMYSRPDPHFAENELIPNLPDGKLSWWNVRNDDIYNLRWGDPEFVKQFILHFPSDRTAGYYMGSDRYTWGRESISKNPLSPRQLENEKHWYRFLLWGRLGYDPDTQIPLLKGLINYRFPSVSADVLFDAWQAASRIIPLVNQVHWKDWDYLWWVEACISSGVAGAINGYHNIDDFINIGTMPGSDITSISSFAGGNNAGTSPLEAAGQIETYAQDALVKIALISDGGNMELKETIGDIKAQAFLGLYYAKKIRGAVDLSRYRQGKGSQYKTSAVSYLEESLEHWKDYASSLDAQYNKMVLAFNGLFDWDALEKKVENDIELARNAK